MGHLPDDFPGAEAGSAALPEQPALPPVALPGPAGTVAGEG